MANFGITGGNTDTNPGPDRGRGDDFEDLPSIEDAQQEEALLAASTQTKKRKLGPLIAAVIMIFVFAFVAFVFFKRVFFPSTPARPTVEMPFGTSPAMNTGTIAPAAPPAPAAVSAPAFASAPPTNTQPGFGVASQPAAASAPVAPPSPTAMASAAASAPAVISAPVVNEVPSPTIPSTSESAPTIAVPKAATTAALEREVADLRDRVKELESSIETLKAKEEKPRPQRRVVEEKVKSTTAVTKTVSASPATKGPSASLQAVIPGQAWVRQGNTVYVVHVGDTVPGLGKILAIHPERMQVDTAAGTIR